MSIDLRHGDLGDDEVIALLVQLARERAGLDAAEGPDASGSSEGSALGEPGPPGSPERAGRRRWALLVLVALAVALATAVGAFAIRARPDQVTAADQTTTVIGPGPLATAPERPDAATSVPSTSTGATPPSGGGSVAEVSGPAEQRAAFCRAVSSYPLDDPTALAERGVRDPRGTVRAYAEMVANAPPEIAPDVMALGPITGEVQAKIEDGTITTPKQMQEYLASGAPADEVTRWIAAQQKIVGRLPELCPARTAP